MLETIFPLIVIGSLVMMVVAIKAMSSAGHAREIYLIWYINSFFFMLFYGVGIIAEERNVRLTEICGVYEDTCKSIYHSLTDVDDEALIIAVVAALVIGPQLLTYLLSGLSGSASPPKFVSQIGKISIWSFVKFTAGVGGIFVAEPFVKLTMGKPVTLYDFIYGARWTPIAFIYATTYILFTESIPQSFHEASEANNKGPLRAIFKVHKFFTRNTRDQ